MLGMADTRRLVERVIETDPVIRRGLQRGIVNSRALVRLIQKENGIDASSDAILGIIRRYPLPKEESADLEKLLRKCKLAMRGKVAALVLENGPQTMKRISDFAASVSTMRGEYLRVSVGLRSITVVGDQKELAKFMQIFDEKQIIDHQKDLVEISILLTKEAIETKGLYATITGELALNGLNLISLDTSYLEIVLFFDQKSAPKALEILQYMISSESLTREVDASP